MGNSYISCNNNNIEKKKIFDLIKNDEIVSSTHLGFEMCEFDNILDIEISKYECIIRLPCENFIVVKNSNDILKHICCNI